MKKMTIFVDMKNKRKSNFDKEKHTAYFDADGMMHILSPEGNKVKNLIETKLSQNVEGNNVIEAVFEVNACKSKEEAIKLYSNE